MIIKAPTNYSGDRCGVRFVNGVGVTDNAYIIDWFAKHGYTVEEGKSFSAGKPTRSKRTRTTKTED